MLVPAGRSSAKHATCICLTRDVLNCAGLRKGQRQAIAVRPQAMLEAKDLQKCDLSNYLTERLDSVLERDRMLRAERDGCPLEHVSPKNLVLQVCTPCRMSEAVLACEVH